MVDGSQSPIRSPKLALSHMATEPMGVASIYVRLYRRSHLPVKVHLAGCSARLQYQLSHPHAGGQSWTWGVLYTLIDQFSSRARPEEDAAVLQPAIIRSRWWASQIYELGTVGWITYQSTCIAHGRRRQGMMLR